MHTSNQSSVTQQNISYYNEIAEQYNATLDKDHSNEVIRQQVAGILHKLVPSGIVLDFGGGTGKDLEWLSKKEYGIIFCEPSVKMREKAILYNKKNPSQRPVTFLDDSRSDFTSWQHKLPFLEKADAVIANFAVINCIPEIELLFKTLSLVTKPGAHVLMLVLKSDFRKRWRSNRRAAILSLLTGDTVTTRTQFNQQLQIVHLHTTNKIKKAAADHFEFQSSRLLQGNDFVLIHLIRK
jgi:SAM-dependent methyltransferase